MASNLENRMVELQDSNTPNAQCHAHKLIIVDIVTGADVFLVRLRGMITRWAT